MQLAFHLETPEQHAQTLHPSGIGKITIARRVGGRWTEDRFSVEDLPQVARLLHGAEDVYISQNRFFGRRLIANLAQADALFTDLDYYRVPALSGKDPLSVYHLALEALEDATVVCPDLGIATGRGVAMLWLHSPIPRSALPRWNACQKHLYEILKPLGADSKALDAARVLRVIGTINSTSNTLVRSFNAHSGAYWDFDTLASEILPKTRAEVKSLAIERSKRAGAAPKRPPQQFTPATLWEGRLTELQALRRHRHQTGQLPPGQRDAWLFLAAVAISWIAPPATLRREIYGLAEAFAGWRESETRSRMQSVISRAMKAAKGEKVEWNGQQIDARYHFRDETIVEWLNITEDEMRLLRFRHLVTNAIAAERHRQKAREHDTKKRRSAGLMTRAEYQHQAAERQEKATVLRASGMTWQEVGLELGITARAARMLASRAAIEKGTSPFRCMVAEPSPSSCL